MSSFIDFLYGTTVWNLGVTVSAIVLGGTIIALQVVDRLWHRDLRRSHNEIAGFLIAVVGVIFAILVSSLAITVLERKDRAEALVTQEAEALETIDREADLLQSTQRTTLRQDVRDYVKVVLDREWPQMRRAERPTAASDSLNKLWRDVAALPVGNLAEMLTVQSLRQQLDRLSDDRRGRAEIATTGVDRVIWGVVLLGSVSTILFAVMFGVPNFLAHTVMTGLLSFVIALAIIMIVAIDWPYFGADSVGPERIADLYKSLQMRSPSSP